ncbi:Alpha/Beta hydrolase protein [Mycena leptocephala]|nr:Alpha/Beta hydrolase protein [Mycena leptocephala]
MRFSILAFCWAPLMDEQHVLGLNEMQDDAITYEYVSHPAFTDYSLRIKKPTLCDNSVNQYSGYLDIAEDKHLFFWFFESRDSPSSDPLVLWLNGGPGCSSTVGLLFELGPCNINKTEDGTVFTSHNPYAVDVYAFLQLFVKRFEDYATRPFHLAAESYGGHYAPNIASIVHRKNKQLAQAPSSGLRRINLQSVMLGNALTDPLIQMPSVVGYACDGPFAVFDTNSRQCRDLRSRAPICERMIKACYALDNTATCSPATFYCWYSLWSILDEAKRNIYDVRMSCDGAVDPPLCYVEPEWITEYLNLPQVRKELGVDPRAPDFAACNNEMNFSFIKSLLTELVDEGIRLLIYAGNVDMMCNYMGHFGTAPFLPWTVSDRQAGVVRSAGEGAGNVTYLTVFEAGHMVPHDQPEAALDMLNRWIRNIPLAD